MTVKLAVKISDVGLAAHVGGDPQTETHIVELESEELEQLLARRNDWVTVSISEIKKSNKSLHIDRQTNGGE